jgi:hypothetical protein
MQGRKNNLSIFSFKPVHRGFLKQVLVFFIPVVLIFTLVEYFVLQIPANYITTSNYFNSEKDNIEILALGPSQMNSAINPAYFNKPAICLASTSQHHNLDFEILKQTKDRLPKLKYVILELSFSHLELPHNSKDFWKNSIYLKYYGVNAFKRKTYFKDRLIFLSNPDIYSRKLVEHYIERKESPHFNRFGFDEDNYDGLFKGLKYDEKAITQKPFRINSRINEALFNHNLAFLYKMLDYTESEGLKVIVCSMPLYKTYVKERDTTLVRRRDSVLDVIQSRYANVRIFNKESDTINYIVSDYINQNHLNPRGAEKFTKELNSFMTEQFPN